jgi:beta-N-acetylhexosaminidase
LGQLLVIGFDGTETSPRLVDLLTRLQPGGVILFTRNMASVQQMRRLLKDCQARVREPLFACVDLEGGRVDRFREILGPTPSAAEVFASADDRFFHQHGKLIGNSCRALGFNVNFAPVLDLAFEASRNVMGTRSVSAKAREVVEYARNFLAGLAGAGVIGAGKHFPGLGEGTLDSHAALPLIEKAWHRLWEEDLVPYRKMRRELPMVLVNHANYPSVTHDDLPASLSKKWISDVLRRRIGYRGLIVSDDLEMGGVSNAASVDEAVVSFIRAGGDLGLICHRQELVEQAFETMQRTYERDARFRRCVHESARRVMAFKRKHAKLLATPAVPSQSKVERLSRQLWEFGERVRLQGLASAARTGAEAS